MDCTQQSQWIIFNNYVIISGKHIADYYYLFFFGAVNTTGNVPSVFIINNRMHTSLSPKN